MVNVFLYFFYTLNVIAQPETYFSHEMSKSLRMLELNEQNAQEGFYSKKFYNEKISEVHKEAFHGEFSGSLYCRSFKKPADLIFEPRGTTINLTLKFGNEQKLFTFSADQISMNKRRFFIEADGIKMKGLLILKADGKKDNRPSWIRFHTKDSGFCGIPHLSRKK